MFAFLSDFRKDESGAVTVDWVVLCAGIVALAAAVFLSMESGTLALTDDVDVYLAAQDPNL